VNSPSLFTSGERDPSNHWIWSRVGPGVCFDS